MKAPAISLLGEPAAVIRGGAVGRRGGGEFVFDLLQVLAVAGVVVRHC